MFILGIIVFLVILIILAQYNLETIPTNIIASLFSFKPAELFQIEEFKKENINIEM